MPRRDGKDGLASAPVFWSILGYGVRKKTFKTAPQRVKGMPVAWNFNHGCQHACHYCYARAYRTYIRSREPRSIPRASGRDRPSRLWPCEQVTLCVPQAAPGLNARP